MAQRNVKQPHSNKADIQLAILSINKRQFAANQRAAAVYSVPEATLRHRRAGRPAQRHCQPNSKKLTEREEEVIVSYILNLDLREFFSTYTAIYNIANSLLAIYSAS